MNKIVFWELATHDQDRTVDFFQEVFGWEISFDTDLGFYTVSAESSCDGPLEGGIFTLKKARLPFLTIYIEVEDIDGMCGKIEAAGGSIVEGPLNITERSKICLFNEPSGVTFAMIERTKKS